MSAAEVSQGSVVTCLRCDGKYNKGLAANLLQSSTVKNFQNWSTFAKVMLKTRVVCFFFRLRVVINLSKFNILIRCQQRFAFCGCSISLLCAAYVIL